MHPQQTYPSVRELLLLLLLLLLLYHSSVEHSGDHPVYASVN